MGTKRRVIRPTSAAKRAPLIQPKLVVRREASLITPAAS